MPESALAETLRRGKMMEQMLSGRLPSLWESIDKPQLAGALWGIFSTHIAPDMARSITRGLSAPTGRPGASYELDLVILADFDGMGLSFTIRR